MSELRWQAWTALVAFVMALGDTLYPGPFLMGAFTFIAQQLLVLAMLGYARKVSQELKWRKIL